MLYLQLSGLTCAACSIKTEKMINKLSEVKSAQINFASETMRVQLADKANPDDALHQIKRIIREIEPLCRLLKKILIMKLDSKKQMFLVNFLSGE
jgi:cation transport ATPase